MILPSAQDAIHKSWLNRLLIEILDNELLCINLFFKGGTCATMQGFLDRFSVDLDFDYKKGSNKDEIVDELEKIILDMNLEIKDKSKIVMQYILKYGDWENKRNSLKLEIIGEELEVNDYERVYLVDVDRYAICQTKETMFANKLVALVDRFEKHKTIAGRDVYDINHFFLQGYGYKKEVVEFRRGVKVNEYLKYLLNFVDEKVTETIITQDLSFLLPLEKFKVARKNLKREVMMFLREEIKN